MKHTVLTLILLYIFCAPSFAQTTAIPDAAFEQRLIDLGYDTGVPDGSVLTANISGVTTLELIQDGISDLTGIEDFTALQLLKCNDNLLTSIDVSQNLNLLELHCAENQLTSLDVTSNVLLQNLELGYNSVTSLDISQNPGLTRLRCQWNQLTLLDVTQNPVLSSFSCGKNQLTSINVTQNPLLSSFWCGDNSITSVDVTSNLDLTFFNCSDNLLTSIDLTQNPQLGQLNCARNQLTNLDLSSNPILNTLSTQDNQLTSLDVTANTFLQTFYCGQNSIGILDLSQNINLVSISCPLNQLSQLDVSNNPLLEAISCVTNNITSLNLTENPALLYVRCQDNDLHCLNVKNGTNPNIIAFDAYNNPNLLCIDVDNPQYSSTNWTSVDPQSSFSYFCFCLGPKNTIQGNIQLDIDANCLGERPLEHHILRTSGGNYNFSDALGNYVLYCDSGTTLVDQLPSNNPLFIDQTCPVLQGIHTVEFAGTGLDSTGLDFYNDYHPCPLLTVDVFAGNRRRCFSSTSTVKYCNEGFADTNNVQVYVEIPDYVYVLGVNMPYTINSEGYYVFNIGNLAQGVCGYITFTDSIPCINGITGLTQCTRAWITPENDCANSLESNISFWDQSSVWISGDCLGDSIVEFVIYNIGIADMDSASEYRIYLNAGLSLTAPFQLQAGDSLVVQVVANGQTVRIEADQNFGFPGSSNPNYVIEACGSASPSYGYVSQQPNDDNDPDMEFDCGVIVDSFDPNDKRVQPTGIGAQKYVQPSTLLDYTVRFQNTGSDTAYTVMVLDTLASALDIETIDFGVSSHPYDVSIIDQSPFVLMFTFSNINLLDSTSNEAESHGFFRYKIAPFDSIPNGTEIHNAAEIFFDYNDPIRTNDAWVTIHDTVFMGSPLTTCSGILGVASTGSLSITTCENYTVPSGDETYLTSGVVMDTIPNATGCDSVVTINLTILSAGAGAEVITTCNSYTVPSGDETYNLTGTYLDTVSSATGCDSIITINLTINNLSVSTLNENVCSIYTVPSGDETYTSNGTYFDTIPNVAGCDSILTINLMVNNTSSSISAAACSNYTVPSGDETYTSNGTYYDTIPNVAGCDSMLTINLVIGNTANQISPSVCDSYTVPSGNVTYTTSGIYIDTLLNSAGCDSIITIDLTITSIDTAVTSTDPTLTSTMNGATYQWLDCDDNYSPIPGETSQSFTASVNGLYAVVVDLNGCIDTSDCHQITHVGIVEEDVGGTFNVFPNPTSGSITLDFGKAHNQVSVTVKNVIGQQVFTRTYNASQTIEFDLEGPTGVYFIEVSLGDQMLGVVKVVKAGS